MRRGSREGTGAGTPAARRTLGAYAIAMFAVLLVHLAWPGARGVTWTLPPLIAAAAQVVGVGVNRATARLPWLLFAAGMAFWGVQTALLAAGGQTSSIASTPLSAQIFNAVGYVLSLAGLILLVRGGPGNIRAGVLDGLTLACALALLGWAFLVVPNIDNGTGAWDQRAIALVYPLSGALRAPIIARLFVGGTARCAAAWLLAAGAVASFGSDIALCATVMTDHALDLTSPALSVGAFLAYLLWGAAGLHPSMRQLGSPTRPAPVRGPWVRIVALGTACLIAPVALLAWAASHGLGELTVLGVFACVAILLVLTRLGFIFADYRRAGVRERIVGAAGAAMVAAVQPEDVLAAVERAGQALFSPEGEGRLAVAWADGEADKRGELVPTAGLEPGLGDRAAGHPMALVFPLARAHLPAGQKRGVLIAGGTAPELIALHKSVQTIAAQAALALDRVELAERMRRRENEDYFRTLIQNAADGILLLADDGWIRYASPSAARLFAPRQLVGRRLRDLIGDADADRLRELVLDRRTGHVDLRLRIGGRPPSDIHVTADDLRRDPTVGAIVLTLRDVTEQRRLEAELTRQALQDPLTGLPNRRFFQQRLRAAFAEAGSGSGSDSDQIYLLLIDLDDFKEVNDTRGHSVGDRLLVTVGERLTAAVRPADVVARIGGDEFAVLLHHVGAARTVRGLAERIVRAFSSPIPLDHEPVGLGVSIGFAGSGQSADAEELLRDADLALYAAKNDGKRRWRQYESELHQNIVERTAIRASLDQAIAEHTLAMVYQPVVELGSGRLAGFEALARWPHPEHGLLAPDRFIPMAEETGQIVPLGRWILRRAVAEAAAWQAGPAGERLWVAVNVSGRQLADRAFVDDVAEALADSGVPPELVALELTETALVRHGGAGAWKPLDALKELGVRIALDDFGTGFSSLSYLSDLPVDILKIDKSFVARIAESNDGTALVEGIIRIADALRISVIAEGIETEAQRERLNAAGCGFGQGFLFGRPMGVAQVHEMLQRHQRQRRAAPPLNPE